MCGLSPEVLTAIATIVLAALTAVLAGIGVLQLFAFNREGRRARTAEERIERHETHIRLSSERELRAYIHLEKTSVENVEVLNKLIIEKEGDNPPNDFHYVLVFQNTGKTPAYDVTCSLNIRTLSIDFRDADKLPPMDFTADSEKWISMSSIGPNGRIVKPALIIHKIKDEGLDFVLAKKAALFIYGTITYRDTFGELRKTDFRFMHFIWEHESKLGKQLAICSKGNDAT